MRRDFCLTDLQAVRLRKLVRLYKPRMGKSWKRRSPDQLWLRVLSQIVVAGNAAPGYTLQYSAAVRERLGYSQLKKLPPRTRRGRLHSVLRAIGTRYVGKKPRNRKVNAALHNFDVLVRAGGPERFFNEVAKKKQTEAKIEFLADQLKYYKKKGCRDILIELRLASDCMALDQRLKNILIAMGGTISGSVDRQYEQIERELLERVAKPSGLSGGELDRVLFQNYPDLMVRLLCP
jgi:hypothetical protein